MKVAGRIILYTLLAAAAAGSFLLDDPVRDWVLINESRTLARFAHVVGVYCDWAPLMLAAVVLLAIAHLARSDRWRRIILAMIVASTLSGIVANLIRLTTGRTRPRAAQTQGFYGPRHQERWITLDNDFNSFPSGHMATAAGFTLPLLIAAPAIGIPALVLPAGVGFARLSSGSHHPSDLALSILIAAAISDLTWRRLRPRPAPLPNA
jgi:membrane-associated phospholipid phosphatase